MSEDILAQLTESVVQARQEEARALTTRALQAGLEPLAIIDRGLTPGMRLVGDKFACGEAFIPHLVMAGRTMKSAMALLEPELKRRSQTASRAGVAVIGTVKGDIHEIGKSLVGIMLTAGGFEVYDLGVDVPVEAFVAKARETGADVVGLSALLTTTMVVQRRVIEALDQAGLRPKVRVMVGGAPVKASWAKDIGADGYAEDANGAVELAKRLVG
ncbi:MAG TPA: corrinoid protein [Anaerolineales bacterium]|nr:corrinoid protein [Anaerolineales bacterium]